MNTEHKALIIYTNGAECDTSMYLAKVHQDELDMLKACHGVYLGADQNLDEEDTQAYAWVYERLDTWECIQSIEWPEMEIAEQIAGVDFVCCTGTYE